MELTYVMRFLNKNKIPYYIQFVKDAYVNSEGEARIRAMKPYTEVRMSVRFESGDYLTIWENSHHSTINIGFDEFGDVSIIDGQEAVLKIKEMIEGKNEGIVDPLTNGIWKGKLLV